MIRRLTRYAIYAGLIYVITIVAVLVQHHRLARNHGADPAPDHPVHIVLVLSGGQTDAGTLAHNSQARTERGVALALSLDAPWVIFTGTDTRPGRTEPTTDLMRDLAIKLGLPESRIVTEPTARTTLQNLLFSYPIAAKLGATANGSNVVIVTDAMHATRSMALARIFGFGEARIVTSDSFARYGWHNRIRTVTREAAAWWYNLGKVIVWKSLDILGVPQEKRLEIVG